MGGLDLADRRAAGLAIALAGITGFTTVVGWLSLAGVFFGPQSGNVVIASAQVAEGDWRQVMAHGVPVVVFFTALVVGYVGSERASQRFPGWQVEVGVLAAEAMLLTAAGAVAVTFEDEAVGLAPHTLAGMVTAGLAISAIGLQSSAVRPVLGERVNTIATTGLLIGTARDLAVLLERGRDAPATARSGLRARSAMLGAYVGLGVVGGIAERALGFGALFAAAGVVAALAVLWWGRRPADEVATPLR